MDLFLLLVHFPPISLGNLYFLYYTYEKKEFLLILSVFFTSKESKEFISCEVFSNVFHSRPFPSNQPWYLVDFFFFFNYEFDKKKNNYWLFYGLFKRIDLQRGFFTCLSFSSTPPPPNPITSCRLWKCKSVESSPGSGMYFISNDEEAASPLYFTSLEDQKQQEAEPTDLRLFRRSGTWYYIN